MTTSNDPQSQRYHHLLNKIDKIQTTLQIHTIPHLQHLELSTKQLSHRHNDLLSQLSSLEATKNIQKRTKHTLETSIGSIEEGIDQYTTQTTESYKQLAELKQQHVDKSICIYLPAVLELESKFSTETLQDHIRTLQQSITQAQHDVKYITSIEGKQEFASVYRDLSEKHQRCIAISSLLQRLKQIVWQSEKEYEKNTINRFSHWNLYTLGFSIQDYDQILNELANEIKKYPDEWANIEKIGQVISRFQLEYDQPLDHNYSENNQLDFNVESNSITHTSTSSRNEQFDNNHAQQKIFSNQNATRWNPVSDSLLSQIDESSVLDNDMIDPIPHTQQNQHDEGELEEEHEHQNQHISSFNDDQDDNNNNLHQISNTIVLNSKNKIMIELHTLLQSSSPLNTILLMLRPWAYLLPSALSTQLLSLTDINNEDNKFNDDNDQYAQSIVTFFHDMDHIFSDESSNSSFSALNTPKASQMTTTTTTATATATTTTTNNNNNYDNIISKPQVTTKSPNNTMATRDNTESTSDSISNSDNDDDYTHDIHNMYRIDHKMYDTFRTLFHIQDALANSIESKTKSTEHLVPVSQQKLSISSTKNVKNTLNTPPNALKHQDNNSSQHRQSQFNQSTLQSQDQPPLYIIIAYMYQMYSNDHNISVLQTAMNDFLQLLPILQRYNIIPRCPFEYSDNEQDQLYNIYEQLFLYMRRKIEQFVSVFRTYIFRHQ